MSRLYRLQTAKLITMDTRFGSDFSENQLVEVLKGDPGLSVEIRDKSLHIVKRLAVGTGSSEITYFEDSRRPFSTTAGFLRGSFLLKDQPDPVGNEFDNSPDSDKVEALVSTA